MRRIKFVGTRVLMFGLVGGGILGLVISGLWNALMPGIFGLPAIGFWQALGLFLLGRLLVGGFGGGRGKWRDARFARGWQNLTAEERQRFRDAMGTRCPERFRADEGAEKG